MKKKIIYIIIAFILLLLIIGAYIAYKDYSMVPVLGYHSVLPKELRTNDDNLITEEAKFDKEMAILKKLGYHSMTLDEFYCWHQGKCPKKSKSILITFDDGYLNNKKYAFPILKKYGMNAVAFYIGSLKDSTDNVYMNLKDIEEVNKEYPNITFASHGYDLHFHSDKDYQTVADDIALMKEVIDTKYYAYPYGDYNDNYIKALKDNSYQMAFTFGPGREHRKANIKDNAYTIPRLNISNDMPYWKFILRLFLPI